MSGSAARFTLIEDDAPPAAKPVPVVSPADQAARTVLFTALRALSQRAATAVTNLFSLVLVGSVWTLASRVLDDPTEHRLYGLFGYAAFCLAVDIARRRHK